MRKLQSIPLCLSLSGALLVGCGGGGVNSGVDGNKTGSELTPAELDQVCEATLNYLEAEIDVADYFCTVAGIIVGQLAADVGGNDEDIQTACTDAYDTCLDSDELEMVTDNLTCDSTPDEAPDCEATVSQYERCMTDSVNQSADYVRSIPSCATLTEENVDQAADLVDAAPTEPPVSCEVVDETCPNALAGLYPE